MPDIKLGSSDVITEQQRESLIKYSLYFKKGRKLINTQYNENCNKGIYHISTLYIVRSLRTKHLFLNVCHL